MMKRILRSFGVFLVLGFFALSNFAFGPAAPLLQGGTPGPKVKPTPVPLTVEAGHSDGIAILGILIFIFIVVPIALRYREWRST